MGFESIGVVGVMGAPPIFTQVSQKVRVSVSCRRFSSNRGAVVRLCVPPPSIVSPRLGHCVKGIASNHSVSLLSLAKEVSLGRQEAHLPSRSGISVYMELPVCLTLSSNSTGEVEVY